MNWTHRHIAALPCKRKKIVFNQFTQKEKLNKSILVIHRWSICLSCFSVFLASLFCQIVYAPFTKHSFIMHTQTHTHTDTQKYKHIIHLLAMLASDPALARLPRLAPAPWPWPSLLLFCSGLDLRSSIFITPAAVFMSILSRATPGSDTDAWGGGGRRTSVLSVFVMSSAAEPWDMLDDPLADRTRPFSSPPPLLPVPLEPMPRCSTCWDSQRRSWNKWVGS